MESLEIMPIRVRITAILKKAIYAGEYKSGEELSLTGIAEQLGVSRTPVREAFQALAAEGLITLRMNKGAIVNQIDEKFIRDNFAMRILLEGEAAALAAAAGADMSSLLERTYYMKETAGPIGRKEYETLNQDIHMTIWNAAGNSRLKQYLLDLWNGPSAGQADAELQKHYRSSVGEHIAILEAIRDRLPEQARQEMAKHISRSMDNILRCMRGS